MAELDDTVRELARLVTAALACDMATSVQASGRVAVRLGVGDDDGAGAAEAALRKALGLSGETAATGLAEPGRKTVRLLVTVQVPAVTDDADVLYRLGNIIGDDEAGVLLLNAWEVTGVALGNPGRQGSGERGLPGTEDE